MEENEKKLVVTTDFVSRSFGGGRARRPGFSRSTRRERAPESRKGGSAYLLVRLGICALCFCAVLGLKLKGDERTLAVIGEATQGRDGTAEDTEELGRLRFVELPSIVDVFAPAEKAVLPVRMISCEKDDEGGLSIVTVPGAEVISPIKGVVKAVGEDASLGGYVTIERGELEFTVYGLGEILVEKGQPVSIRQKIGTARDASVTVRAVKDGLTVDLEELFKTDKESK